MKKLALIAIAGFILVSCGTHRTAISDNNSSIQSSSSNAAKQKLDYVRKVTDNAVFAKNIVSKISFSIDAMGKDISVDGKLNMRKNEVIRIVLTPLGLMEVGRVEFTPDYVLLMDRINKEYVKASYSEVDFLQKNGLDFYSLQSLFWNELFIPGQQKMSDNMLQKFDVDLSNETQRTVSLSNNDLDFSWNTTASTGMINSASAQYRSNSSNASTVTWNYGSFVAMGSKSFPTDQAISFSSKAVKAGQKMTVTIKLKKPSNDADWDAKTTVSDKYTKISAEDILRKLISF